MGGGMDIIAFISICIADGETGSLVTRVKIGNSKESERN
jgi:hypothetical protein